MSHFDNIWPGIVNGLAALGFFSLLALGGFFFIMARQALEDRVAQRKTKRAQQNSLETLRDKWQSVGMEHH
jgi:hypothetical protein